MGEAAWPWEGATPPEMEEEEEEGVKTAAWWFSEPLPDGLRPCSAAPTAARDGVGAPRPHDGRGSACCAWMGGTGAHTGAPGA